MARKLKKPQASVSRMEQQSDMLISTLDETFPAIHPNIGLPGRPPLYLTGLAGLEASRGQPSRVRTLARAKRKARAKA